MSSKTALIVLLSAIIAFVVFVMTPTGAHFVDYAMQNDPLGIGLLLLALALLLIFIRFTKE